MESVRDLSSSGDCDFFQRHVRMGSKIILIVEINGTDNTKSIGDNVKFVSEAEMSFDVLLFHFMVRGIGCGYGSIDSFIWIVRTVKVIGFA